MLEVGFGDLNSPDSAPILLLSGTVGVGKTVVAEAISAILKEHEIPHGFVDRDALSHSWPPRGRFNEEVVLRNLQSVWRNFQEVGAERLVVAGVVETAEDLERYRSILGADVLLVRLTASRRSRESRLRARDTGASLGWHLARTQELEEILDRAGLEDFSFPNEERPISEVARNILEAAKWIMVKGRDDRIAPGFSYPARTTRRSPRSDVNP